MRKTLLAVFLLGCLTGALLMKSGALESVVSAQTPDQTILGPGLYAFQNRLDRATCGDSSNSGYVNTYIAAVNGIPGSSAMEMSLPDSSYWTEWRLGITAEGHIVGVSQQDGVTGPDRGDSHFDLTRSGDQFTGRGARSYMSTVNGQRRRCTVEFDTLLRRIDR